MRKKKMKFVKSMCGHFIDEKTLEMVLDNPSALSFGVEMKHLTVLSSAIFSFTDYLVKQTLQEAVSNLNEYFTIMVDAIYRYGGTLDKFIGDEIMVEFGVPIHFSDHAERACLAALEMVRSYKRLMERWKQVGKEVFAIRIGINTGDMLVGNLGSKQRFDYTILGDHVNLGLRLKDSNKIYNPANHIIISEFTKNELSDRFVTRELDNIRVKGLVKPIVIHELVGEKDNLVYTKEFLTHYHEGLANYKKNKFQKALGEFKKALILNDDGVSKLYINRCMAFIENPPPNDWN